MSNFEQRPPAEHVDSGDDFAHNAIISDVQAQLLSGEITAYEMVRFSKENPEIVADGLRSALTSHESLYLRLCSAWSLGEIGNPEDLPLLKQLYSQEEEDNVRTNIVWAQFMIDAKQIDGEQFRAFLLDSYYVIPLVAVKRLSGMPHLVGRYDFYEYYENQENQLVHLEMLRNIRSFRMSEDVNAKLEAELRTTDHLLERSELVQAIGLSNQIDSMSILMNYYREFKYDIIGNELMAHSVVNAIFSLGQSDAHEILQEIYVSQSSHIIRWRIIESLAMAGGPYSLAALRNVHAYEQNRALKDAVRLFIDMMTVTTE